MWDWADPKVYLHDEIATDKRNPTVNANGPIYGALEESADYMPVVDPTTQHGERRSSCTVRDPKTPSAADTPPAQPSPYWGDEAIWNSQTTRAQLRDGQAGARLGRGAHPPSRDAGVVPGRDRIIRRRRRSRSRRAARQMQMYDPKTKQITTDRHLLRHAAT